MDRCDNASYDLVFFVHLTPIFVGFWEYFEVPKLLITEGPKSRKFNHLPFFSFVFFFHHVDKFDWKLTTSLWRREFFYLLNDFLWRKSSGHNNIHSFWNIWKYVKMRSSKNRRLRPSLISDRFWRWSKLVIVIVVLHRWLILGLVYFETIAVFELWNFWSFLLNNIAQVAIWVEFYWFLLSILVRNSIDRYFLVTRSHNFLLIELRLFVQVRNNRRRGLRQIKSFFRSNYIVLHF